MPRLRRQLILIHRQFADDACLLIGALAVALVLLLVLAFLTFIYPTDQLLHMACVLVVLPFLVGAGMCFLGIVQTHGAGNCDAASALSLWPVTSRQLTVARIVVGAAFVVVVVACLGIAISGAAITGLIAWPESLFPFGLVDLSTAMLLMGLSCYCLGFLGGRRTASMAGGLCLLPVVIAFASLVVLKGFGRPLAIVLIPFVLALLANALTSTRCPGLAAISLGFTSLTLVLVPLYWLRYSSDVVTSLMMLTSSDKVEVRCHLKSLAKPRSHLYDGSFIVHGSVDHQDFPARYGYVHFLLRPIGIMSYLQAKEPGDDLIGLGHFGDFWGAYYDGRKGLFVNREVGREVYMGPRGASDMPTKDIGRFVSPIVYTPRWKERIIFDRGTRDFYVVDLQTQDVRPGLSLADSAFQPADPSRSRLDSGVCSVYCQQSVRDRKDQSYAGDDGGLYLPVVDAEGTVAVVDRRTWRLLPNAGCLPRPNTFYGRGSSRAGDLFDYEVRVIVGQPAKEYAGLMMSVLSRQGATITVAVFDKDGRLVEESRRGGRLGIPIWFATKYLVESLHPPILTLASFFTAYSFDAGATHRALFLVPNSFVALQRDRETGRFFQLLWALVFLMPAMLFSGFLAWRVVRDAAALGLPRRTRGLWLAGTAAFGLPAYLTYRLLRPRVVTAPCRQCGTARRVDQDLCHHCGGRWEGPVLDSPAWRIIDDVSQYRARPSAS